MKICASSNYASIETALKEAGLGIDKVVKQGKKTVITVSSTQKTGKNRQFLEKK